MSQQTGGENTEKGEVELRGIALFGDGARLLGLPKSVGEIYGILFMRPTPMSLDELVAELGISKGSASQGLKFLRQLGAVEEQSRPGVRRSHYRASVELKALIGGFIREKVRPQLEATGEQLAELDKLVDEGEVGDLKDFYRERVDRLKRWTGRARMMLPLLQRVMGE